MNTDLAHKLARLEEFENTYSCIFNENNIPYESFYDLIKLQDLLEELKLNLIEVEATFNDDALEEENC